jgi:hypothetical protein
MGQVQVRTRVRLIQSVLTAGSSGKLCTFLMIEVVNGERV